jgi:hypothetical protein
MTTTTDLINLVASLDCSEYFHSMKFQHRLVVWCVIVWLYDSPIEVIVWLYSEFACAFSHRFKHLTTMSFINLTILFWRVVDQCAHVQLLKLSVSRFWKHNETPYTMPYSKVLGANQCWPNIGIDIKPPLVTRTVLLIHNCKSQLTKLDLLSWF